MAEAVVALVIVYLLLTAARVTLAATSLRRAARRTAPARTQDVTVLVPVRSGDPLLGRVLAEQAAGLDRATLVLLVDDDDADAITTAARVAGGASGAVEVRRCPPPEPGVNPKVAKLAAAAPGIDGLVAVLDDDTVLPPGAITRAVDALRGADLVTGVPVYREQGGPWARLVAAFVNGSSLLSYLPLARLTPPVSVNGMFVLTRSAALAQVGGFAAIDDQVCDDYALARGYRRAGLRIAQTTIVHPLTTTVDGPVAYARLMRRWTLFAAQVGRRDPTPALLILVVAPTYLPPVALLLALIDGGAMPLVVLAALVIKALATRWLRGLAPPAPTGAAGPAFEVLADLLSVGHALAAVLGPHTVVWRGRRVRVTAPR